MSDDGEASESDAFLAAVAHAPALSPRPSRPLTQLAHFRIEEELGRGGMGIVYRAVDEKLRRTVALKVLPESFDDDDERRRRFMREARVAASVAHPNVAAVYDVGEADGRIFIAMELVGGSTLRRRMDGGPLPIEEAVRVVSAIARGLAQAHARGIAHRDLKPDNVMLGDDGAVKVLDFGLAKPVAESEAANVVTRTVSDRIVGTPGYMSPEQATGRPIDVRTDVFALGVMLYEMTTGKRPFVGETTMDVLMATSRDEHVSARKHEPRISDQLDAIIERCLEKQPAQRWQNAEALLAALEGMKTVKPTRSRTPLVAGAAIALALAVVVVRVRGTEAKATPLPDPTPAVATTAAEVIAAPPPTLQAATATPTASELPPAIAERPARAAAPPPRALPRASASAAPVVPTPSTAPISRGGVIETSPY